MNFAKFFIDRPIFAAVLSILLTLLGAIALPKIGRASCRERV